MPVHEFLTLVRSEDTQRINLQNYYSKAAQVLPNILAIVLICTDQSGVKSVLFSAQGKNGNMFMFCIEINK